MSETEHNDYPVRTVTLNLCEPCINGVGEECHTPACDLYLHAVDIPILAARDDVQATRAVIDLPEPDRREDECGVNAGYWHMRHPGPLGENTDIMSYEIDGEPVVYTGPGPEFAYTVAAMRERCLAGLAACADAERLATEQRVGGDLRV
jgi:hypothetical protein